MAWLSLIITIPLTVFAALFAISNDATVELSFWPFETTGVFPVSVVGLVLLFAGFLLGALFVSLHAQKTKFKLWQETRRADRLEQELELARKQNALPAQAQVSATSS